MKYPIFLASFVSALVGCQRAPEAGSAALVHNPVSTATSTPNTGSQPPAEASLATSGASASAISPSATGGSSAIDPRSVAAAGGGQLDAAGRLNVSPLENASNPAAKAEGVLAENPAAGTAQGNGTAAKSSQSDPTTAPVEGSPPASNAEQAPPVNGGRAEIK